MNDIYWHDKRTMPSKQLSSPPPTQPRRAYENTLRSKHYQQTDFRFNSHLTNISTDNSSYLPYPTISARSHNKNDNFPYTTSIYEVYHQTSPSITTSPSPLHPAQNRHIDRKNPSLSSQQRQLSRSASDDYHSTKYHDLQGFNDENYGNGDEDGDGEGHCSEVFNYAFDDRNVSLKKK